MYHVRRPSLNFVVVAECVLFHCYGVHKNVGVELHTQILLHLVKMLAFHCEILPYFFSASRIQRTGLVSAYFTAPLVDENIRGLF